jgi:hypothetical protein
VKCEERTRDAPALCRRGVGKRRERARLKVAELLHFTCTKSLCGLARAWDGGRSGCDLAILRGACDRHEWGPVVDGEMVAGSDSLELVERAQES